METLPLGTQIQRSVWASAFTLPSTVEAPKGVGFPNHLAHYPGNGRGNLAYTGFFKKPQQGKPSTIPITQMFDTKKPEPKLPGFYQYRGKGQENYSRTPHFVQMGGYANGMDPSGNPMMLTGVRLGNNVSVFCMKPKPKPMQVIRYTSTKIVYMDSIPNMRDVRSFPIVNRLWTTAQANHPMNW